MEDKEDDKVIPFPKESDDNKEVEEALKKVLATAEARQKEEEKLEKEAKEGGKIQRVFLKINIILAYCEMDLLRKQELARTCADRLADLRPRIGKEPILQFSDLTHGGIVHMYAFEIKHRSERQRLVRVIANREVMHDSGEIFDFKQDRQPKGSMKMPFKEDPLKRIPRNAPCPCGSGKKYKRCCMGKI